MTEWTVRHWSLLWFAAGSWKINLWLWLNADTEPQPQIYQIQTFVDFVTETCEKLADIWSSVMWKHLERTSRNFTALQSGVAAERHQFISINIVFLSHRIRINALTSPRRCCITLRTQRGATWPRYYTNFAKLDVRSDLRYPQVLTDMDLTRGSVKGSLEEGLSAVSALHEL